MNPLVLDAPTQAFLDGCAAAHVPPFWTLDADAARRQFAALQGGAPVLAPASVEDVAWPVGPGGRVELRIVRPAGVTGDLGCVVYCPGGIGMSGTRHSHERLARALAHGAGVAVLLVDCDPPPQARYPHQIEQVYAVLVHIAQQGAGRGLDPGRIALAGDGIGAAIATAAALTAKCRRGPAIAQQVLFCPVTDSPAGSDSYAQFGDGPWLTRADVQHLLQHYLPPDVPPHEAPALLLQAPHDLLNDLPETLVVVAECDPLRDEGEAFARKLLEAEVNVTCARHLGTVHGFAVLDALAESASARAAMAQAIAALREALAG